jgi:glutaredoxin
VRTVILYTREGCCLCEEARKAIEQARAREPFRLEVVDIDGDPELRRLYTDEVPVIAIDGKKAFKYRVTAEELLKRMRARG